MDAQTLRAWRSHRQGLDGSLSGASPAEVLSRAGWARSVGGANPYLTIHSRTGASRAAIDASVKDCQIHELPSARGCTYVVPAEDFALALTCAQGFSDDGDLATATKYLGVTLEEIERLSEKVVAALVGQVRDPKQIKEDVGDAVRSLGDEGKKRGVSSTLPMALGRLQSQGLIRRVPVNGRLDQQRYAYTAWSPSPLAGSTLTKDEAMTKLAEKFFRWIGPTRPSEFQWFSALGARAAQAVLAGLDLVPIEDGSDLLIHREDIDEFRAFSCPSSPQYALTASIDGLLLHRREIASLIDPAHASHPLLQHEGKVASGLLDLEDHAIFDRGQLIGLWQFDVDAGKIAWTSFDRPTDELRDAVALTENWIRDDLGDARSFSLDSPESRKPRLQKVREASLVVH